MTRVLVAIALVTIVIYGCYDDGVEYVSDTGLVIYLTIEGGFYGIVDDQNRHWNPSNLQEQFKVDSLRVHFKAIITDLPTVQMWGRTIELISIRSIK